MVNYIDVQEYAVQKGVSEKTVRNWIDKKQVNYIEKYTGKKKKYYIIDEEGSNPPVKNEEDSAIVDAVILPNSSETESKALVSMESITFEKIIENIKIIAESKSKSDEKSIEELKQEIYKLQSEVKVMGSEIDKLKEKLHQTEIENIQLSSEIKLKEMRITELQQSWYKKL